MWIWSWTGQRAHAHVPETCDTDEHDYNGQVAQAARIEMFQVDLDLEHMGELFISQWVYDTSGHLGREVKYKWACDQVVDLTIDGIAKPCYFLYL